MSMNPESMNREQKRAAKRAGQLSADGSPVTNRDTRSQQQSLKSERTKPRQFVREVRGEMKKVNWPTRDEVRRFSTIVLVALVVVTLFVFGVDYVVEGISTFLMNPGGGIGAPTDAGADVATLLQSASTGTF